MIRRLGDEALVTIARAVVVLGAASVILAAVAYLVQGKSEFAFGDLLEPFVTQAVLGTLVWVTLPRQPRNGALWIMVAVVASMGLAGYGVVVGTLATDVVPAEFDTIVVVPSETGLVGAVGWLVFNSAWHAVLLLPTLGILLFPDGRLPSRRWRWVAYAPVAAVIGLYFGYGWYTGPWSDLPYGVDPTEESDLVGLGFFVLTLAAPACVAGLIIRYRRSRGEVRQQIRWVVWGFAIFAVAVFFPRDYESGLSLVITMVGTAVLGITYGIAIMKYRLYDIDVVISRTVLYGLLAAFIGGVYALVVVGIGSWIGAGTSSPGLSIAAVAVIAVVFEPVRAMAQRVANRVVYGRRATPYQVLADLTARLASAESMEGLMERMVQRLAEGTGAARATIRFEEDERVLAVWPPDADPGSQRDDEHVTVIRGADGPLGSLAVLKARGESLTPVERRVVEDLAGSAGMVLNKVRLDADLAERAEELRRSRRRMLDAQGEERRRLERELHDGAQQQIVALKVKLGLAARFADEEGSEGSSKLIRQMADDAQHAIDEIRSLAKGIFPPLLENEGLVAALTAGAAGAPIPVIVEADGVGRLPVDVEAAAYFSITEAITNAVKHSDASRIDVRLTNGGGGLRFTVTDNGSGFETGHVSGGSGIVGMRDRLEAMGGTLTIESAPGQGTTIQGSLPVSVRA